MAAQASIGLRARKKEETRDALRRAAIRLYLEQTPAAVTVQDICTAAGVSTRTFFNYFETKDDAVFDWDRRLGSKLVELYLGRPTEEAPFDALRHTLHTAIPLLVADPGWHERRRLLHAHPELGPKLLHSNSHLAEVLAEAVAERTDLSPDDLYPRMLAGAGLTAMRAALRRWDPAGTDAQLLDLLDEAFEILAAGLPGPQPG